MSGKFVDAAETKDAAWQKARDYIATMQVLGVHGLVSVREVSTDNYFIEYWPPEMPSQRNGKEGDT